MSGLANQVQNSIRARRLFDRGQAILIAVSGGLDSMVLLHVLNELAGSNRWRLVLAHLNHQLRGPSSDADERLVRRTSRKLKLPLLVERAAVREFARSHKLSIEMAARKLRHDFLARAAAQMDIRKVALAHHADDQLELLFLRLLRGSGGEGLGGIKWLRPSPSDSNLGLVRPLLDQPKSALSEYAAEKKIRFREDASNASVAIPRNRIRHELLPLLRLKYQPALDKTILRVMNIIGAEAEFVTQMAREWLRKKQRLPFHELSVAVQRQCIHLQLRRLGIAPDYELVEQLRLKSGCAVSLSRAKCVLPPISRGRKNGQSNEYEDDEQSPPVEPLVRVQDREASPGLLLMRDDRGLIRFPQPEHFRFSTEAMELDVGTLGQAIFEKTSFSWCIRPWNRGARPKIAPGEESFDADKVGTRILLRHWKPGDRFQPIGMESPLKLQDFFTNEKVPRARRHRLILALTILGDVFWVEGLRISERFKLTRRTIRCLHWQWQRL